MEGSASSSSSDQFFEITQPLLGFDFLGKTIVFFFSGKFVRKCLEEEARDRPLGG